MAMNNNLAKSKSMLWLAALVSTSMVTLIPEVHAQSTDTEHASTNKTVKISTPAGSLEEGLLGFGRQADIRLVYPSKLTRGKTTHGVKGDMSTREALTILLQGTGLSYEFVNTNTVILRALDNSISSSASSNDGITRLKPIVVIGDNSRNSSSNGIDPYQTDASVTVISAQTIERFRGTSPADMFRGTPGVSSGEARNGAGSIDMNVRGMQGLGRVAVTLDGTSNSITIAQGYQGISNRSFVDPDLLGGIEITKGSDIASNGIAGTVAMRTIDAKDIVKPGERFGARLKTGFGTNSSTPPPAGTAGGYLWPSTSDSQSVLKPSPYGLDRPSLFTPTSESMSIALGYQGDAIDLVAGYAYRKRGNYHAGTKGEAAKAKGTGVVRQYCPSPIGPSFCSDLIKQYAPHLWVPMADGTELVYNVGPVNYRKGEEILNTQLETQSFLGKVTMRINEDHIVKLGYTGFRSEAGDRLASRITGNMGQPTQNNTGSRTEVDSTFIDYRWRPETNLIDLKTKVWGTYLQTHNQRTFQFFPQSWGGPVHFGLPADFRNGSNTLMWGVDASNKSSFTTQYGKLEVDLGGSLKIEDTSPDENTKYLVDNLAGTPGFFYYAPRDGTHKEWAGFSKFKWSPTEWLTAKAGLKYQRYQSTDNSTPGNNSSSGGFSQSLGLTVTPFDEVQIYGQVSSTLRMPTLFESISVGALSNLNGSLKPERSNNLEVGVNFNTSDLLSNDDLFMAKLEYFDWTISDYVAREFYTDPVTNLFNNRMFNIDKAHFSGIELSTVYENNGFKAEWAANYYTDITFCRLAGHCEEKSLYGDYSTNQIPPEYMTNLTLSQKFFSDSLTIGGRVLHVGPRAIGHGDVTGQGAQQFISLVEWKAHTLFDAFAEYEINENLKLSLRGENLTDELYIDPLSLANQPAPGRTIYGSLTIEF